MNGYYSVFDPDGKKIADCGIERDAVNLMHSRNKYWDGHYFTFNPLPGDIVDVSPGKQLPTRDIVVNMDGGVGGSWQEVEYIEVAGQKLELQQSELPEVDLFLLTHNHYDHLDLRSLKMIYKANPDAIFLVPKGDKRRLERRGIENIHEFLWWEEIDLNGSKFTFTPVQHWSARGIADRNKSLWGGWFMELKTESIYHAGDTGYSSDFIETKKRLGSPSLSLIPVGAYAPRWFMKTNHVNPPEAIQVALDLESERNFGMHWGTFQLTDEEIMEPPELLKQSLKKRGLSEEFFRILQPGQVVEF